MVGSPIKRARREAAAKARAEELARAAKSPHTVPPEKPKRAPEWTEDEPKAMEAGLEGSLTALLTGGYHPTPEGEGAVPDVVTEQDKLFTELRLLSLRNAVEIMGLKLDPDHKSFDKLLTRKTAILSAVVSATTRIDAAALRGLKASKIDELLKAIRDEDER